MYLEGDNPLQKLIGRIEKGIRPLDQFAAKCLKDLTTSRKYWGNNISNDQSLTEAFRYKSLVLIRIIGFQEETLKGGDITETKRPEVYEPAQTELGRLLDKYKPVLFPLTKETDLEVKRILTEERLQLLASMLSFTDPGTSETTVCLAYPKPLVPLGSEMLKERGLPVAEHAGAHILAVSYLDQFRRRFPIIPLAEQIT